jgi:hypothetical protein
MHRLTALPASTKLLIAAPRREHAPDRTDSDRVHEVHDKRIPGRVDRASFDQDDFARHQLVVEERCRTAQRTPVDPCGGELVIGEARDGHFVPTLVQRVVTELGSTFPFGTFALAASLEVRSSILIATAAAPTWTETLIWSLAAIVRRCVSRPFQMAIREVDEVVKTDPATV